MSCKKNISNQEINSCNGGIKDTSFKILELVGLEPHQKFFECDTIVASRNLVYFVANDSTADEYSWNFEGYPTIFTGRSITLRLDYPIDNLDITLTVKRNATNACFNYLPAVAHYKKHIAIVSPDNSPLLGRYYGYNASNPTKYFSIFILSNGLKNFPDTFTGNYYFKNEIIYGSCAFFIAGRGTYDPAYGAYGTEGFGYLKEHNKLIIDYNFQRPLMPATYTIVKDTFYGIKE